MRVIIAGSRTITDLIRVRQAMFDAGLNDIAPTRIVCGMARGVDMLGREWAHAMDMPVDEFPADWSTYGKRAGYLRNEQMADNADALVALWDGKSPGTKHMIDIARRKGLKVYVAEVLA